MPSMKTTAARVFHLPPTNFNCAQAVIHAYASVSGDKTHKVENFAKCGGGRVDGGTCGALYAACQVAPEGAEAIRERFSERVGSTICREIKKRSVLCETCVETAAELLEEAVGEQPR